MFFDLLNKNKLRNLLRKRGFDKLETYPNAKSYKFDMEIDIIAANGKDVVVVEVKTTLKKDEVDEFMEKLKKFKSVFHRFSGENIFGAVAYLKDNASSGKYAQKHGLFAIKAVGDSAKIINTKDFRPNSW